MLTESGQRSRNKYPCYLCEKTVAQFSRHLRDAHLNDTKVLSILTIKEKKQRDKEVELLRNKGTFLANSKVLSANSGTLFVRRRSSKQHCALDYLPCTNCFGYFIVGELWRHNLQCTGEKESLNRERRVIIAASQMLNDGAIYLNVARHGDPFWLQIVARMRRDDRVTRVVKSDELILKFGYGLFRKHGPARCKDIISRMRVLGRMLNVLNIDRLERLTLMDLIDGKHFDLVLQSAETLCKSKFDEHGRATFDVPSNGIQLGHALMRVAYLKKGFGIRQNDTSMELEADRFITLHKNEWNESISGRALTTLALRKMTSPKTLPLTEDIVQLNKYLHAKLHELVIEVGNRMTYDAWRDLAEVLLCNLIIFNKRRGGETSKILLTEFVNRPDWRTNTNLEISRCLTPLELQLLKRHIFFYFEIIFSLSFLHEKGGLSHVKAPSCLPQSKIYLILSVPNAIGKYNITFV